MLFYPYETQIQIVVASMTLQNYIKRRSQNDVAFIEYDSNPNFVPKDFFTNFVPNNFLLDVVARSDSKESQRPSHMDFICDEIANSLMRH
jgi:hypothetical protein